MTWQGGAPVFAEPAPVMPVFENTLAAPTPPPLTAGIASPVSSAAQSTWQSTTLASRDIPAGDRCLALLDATGTTYKKLSAKHGIETPVEVTSDIGGVRYEPAAGQTLLCDCRFAVALHRVAPVLKSAGVSRVRFSGAYSYRMSRVGRLSLHAYGLAMDVHELVVNGALLAVRRDFTRGLGNGCASDAPALNQVACRLKSAGMFRELLTPDFNADHWDHFHLGVEPLTNSPVGTVVAKAKKPEAKPVAKPKPAVTKNEPSEPVFVPDEPPALDEIDPMDEEPEVVLDAAPAEAHETRTATKNAKTTRARKKHHAREESAAKESGRKKPGDEKSEVREPKKPDGPAEDAKAPERRSPKPKSRRSARAQGTGNT